METTREERLKQFQLTISHLMETWPGFATWIGETEHTDADIDDIRIHQHIRKKSLDETNYSQYREYEHTGEITITLTIAGKELRKTFTKSELEGKQ